MYRTLRERALVTKCTCFLVSMCDIRSLYVHLKYYSGHATSFAVFVMKKYISFVPEAKTHPVHRHHSYLVSRYIRDENFES